MNTDNLCGRCDERQKMYKFNNSLAASNMPAYGMCLISVDEQGDTIVGKKMPLCAIVSTAVERIYPAMTGDSISV